jgi:hypothetical protein
MTALTYLGDGALDWTQVSIDDIVSRLEATYAEFTDLADDVRQSV